MNKTLLYGLAVIVTLALASCAFAARISPDVAKLLDSRQINCWVEGELLGDIVLGSRGSIQFIYLDEAMSLAIRDDHTLAPWVDDMNQYYGSAGTNKKALFVVQLESNKPWNVEISKFKVGNYSPKMEDILSPSWRNPIGSLASGEKGQFAFVVPITELKSGTEIMVGYGDDLVKWRVPK